MAANLALMHFWLSGQSGIWHLSSQYFVDNITPIAAAALNRVDHSLPLPTLSFREFFVIQPPFFLHELLGLNPYIHWNNPAAPPSVFTSMLYLCVFQLPCSSPSAFWSNPSFSWQPQPQFYGLVCLTFDVIGHSIMP